jgi:phosphate uptake regulator
VRFRNSVAPGLLSWRLASFGLPWMSGLHDLSERTRAIIDEQVVAAVADASRDALVILEAKYDTLDRLSEVLEREELDRVWPGSRSSWCASPAGWP